MSKKEYECGRAGCEVTFMRYPSSIRNDVAYCSQECVHESRRAGEYKACAHCGQEKYVTRAKKTRNKTENVYCDPECRAKGQRVLHAEFQLAPRPRWTDRSKYVSVHQLIAIANGEDPHQVFSSKYNIHHENGCKLDNRHDNIELLDASEHGRIHAGIHKGPYTHKDLLALVAVFLNPSQLG